jgi:hypothetical protein
MLIIRPRTGTTGSFEAARQELDLVFQRILLKSGKTYKLEALDLGSEDPDELLTIFRKEMQPGFPFIAISDSITAFDLRQDRPSLFTAIMAVVSRNSRRQRALGKVFMKQIADRVVVCVERNMDLLLGTLTYGAWYGSNF